MKNANVLMQFLTRRNNTLNIPDADLQRFQSLELQKYGAVVAGGAALRWHTGKQVGLHDIDIWFSDITQYQRMLSRFIENNKSMHDTENAVTFMVGDYKIQLIKAPYSTIDELLHSFDISVVQIATDGARWYYGEHTLQDIADRRLRVLQIHRTILRRVFKYWNYGYTPDDATLQELMNNKEILWDYSSANGDDY